MTKTKAQRPKTTSQVRAIFGEAKKCGLDNDALHDIVPGGSIKNLSYSGAEALLQKLKGRSFVPRRTLQYRRAKSGVQQLVTTDQILLIAALATQRRWPVETLKDFCKRQCKHEKPRTTNDANKVIEALKAMNRREGLWAA